MKSFVISIVLTVCSLSLQGQHLVGGKIGLHHSTVQQASGIEALVPASPYTGLTAGFFAELALNQYISFRPEVLYTQRGFVVDQTTGIAIGGVDIPVGAKLRTRVDYVEMPLLLQAGISNSVGGLYVNSGVSLGRALGGSIQPRVTAFIDWNLPAVDIAANSDNLRGVDASGIVGFGAFTYVPSGRMYIDFRYQHSLTSALDIDLVNIDMISTGIQASVGYAMAF